MITRAWEERSKYYMQKVVLYTQKQLMIPHDTSYISSTHSRPQGIVCHNVNAGADPEKSRGGCTNKATAHWVWEMHDPQGKLLTVSSNVLT